LIACIHRATHKKLIHFRGVKLETAKLDVRWNSVSTATSRRETAINGWSRSFVKVAPPTVYAGVGNALRQAFAMDGEQRSLGTFDDLLDRLNCESSSVKS
jgi:hypothetical protein